MTIDPRTPVLVGYGQVNQRDESPTTEPVDLMEAAARAAADPRVLDAVDSVRMVNLLSWRYRDPGLLLAQRIGAQQAATRYTPIGGNVPQSLVNQACLDIQQRPQRRRAHQPVARRGAPAPGCGPAASKLVGTKQDESVAPAPGSDDEFQMAGPGEIAHPPGPAGLRVPDVRAGAADRGGCHPQRAPAAHRRAVGAVQRGGRRQPARLEPGGADRRGDLRSRARRTG